MIVFRTGAGWEPLHVAKRVEAIVSGTGVAFLRPDKEVYQLGIGNDWWMSADPDGKPNHYQLVYRYVWSVEEYAALKVVLERVLS